MEYRRVINRSAADVAFMERHLDRLYQQCFPLVDDCVSPGTLHDIAGLEQNFVIVAGDDLHSTDQAAVHGFVVGGYLAHSQTGVMWYIGVDEASRRTGLGKNLNGELQRQMALFAAEQGKSLHGLFAEVHDPVKVSPEDDIKDALRASERMQVYKSWQGKIIPCDYVIPFNFCAEDPKVVHAHTLDDLAAGRPLPTLSTAFNADQASPQMTEIYALVSLPVNNRYPPAQTVKDFIAEYHTVIYHTPPAAPYLGKLIGEITEPLTPVGAPAGLAGPGC